MAVTRERWKVWHNGRHQVADVEIELRADLVELCGWCGHACSGRYRFWVPIGGVFSMVNVDRPTLDELIEEQVQATSLPAYPALPAIVREQNEMWGWCDAYAPFTGTPFTADDIASLIAGLRATPAAATAGALLDALDALVAEARAGGAHVWALED